MVGWYVLVTIGIFVFAILLDAFIGIGLGTGNTVAGIFAAAVPGDVFYRRTGSLPSAAFSWRMAGLFTVSNVLLGMLSLIASAGAYAQMLSSSFFWIAFAVLTAISFVALRFAFSWGAKLRQQKVQKRAV
ncbi:ABZJ_00895 family protein [Devosia sp. ZW T5_3]|uniref:ABZJ_00895 family protein n=1 Tax=Devosia sp. ZW T5_3 TaxID=3378085 RepID=UPI003853D972